MSTLKRKILLWFLLRMYNIRVLNPTDRLYLYERRFAQTMWYQRPTGHYILVEDLGSSVLVLANPGNAATTKL